MPLVQTVTSNVRGTVRRSRPGPRGTVKPGGSGTRPFNHFPAIIAAFPDACSAIVVETTEELGAVAAALAPTIQHQRPGDPDPGNLKRSKRTRYYHSRSTAMVVTGRIEFPATDPRGHRYAKPLETGSIRRTRKGLRRVAARPFLVDAIMAERPAFDRRLGELESRLPE